MGLAEFVNHFGRFSQVNIAIQQRHGLGAATVDKEPKRREEHCRSNPQRRQPRAPKPLQASQYILHVG